MKVYIVLHGPGDGGDWTFIEGVFRTREQAEAFIATPHDAAPGASERPRIWSDGRPCCYIQEWHVGGSA